MSNSVVFNGVAAQPQLANKQPELAVEAVVSSQEEPRSNARQLQVEPPTGDIMKKKKKNKKKRSRSQDAPAQPQPALDLGQGPQVIIESKKNPAKKMRPVEPDNSRKVRRLWLNQDERLILEEICRFLLDHKRLPNVKDIEFFESVLKKLEDGSCDLRNVKDKMKSLKRRYDAHVVSTTDHERGLDVLSERIWGPRSAVTAASKNKDQQEAVEAEKSFQEMYPLLTREVMLIAVEQPSAKSLFVGLDAKTALTIETQLEKIKGAELKIQMRMETNVTAPKAKIKKKLVGLLEKVSKEKNKVKVN